MKYSLKHINDKRFDPNRSRERILTERFIPLNYIGKIISPYPTFIFLNLGVHADWVTITSWIFLVAAAALFLIGQAIAAVILLLCFSILDSVDGDMARCAGPSSYGGVLDSFGADIFYGLIPTSIGFYLFSLETRLFGFNPHHILLSAVLVSLTFLLYRTINLKLQGFSAQIQSQTGEKKAVGEVIRGGANSKLLSILVHGYRHPVLRGNFFSEAGMVFWFSFLIIFQAFPWVAAYLIILCTYNIGYLLLNFIGAYIYFVRVDKS